VPEDAKTAAAYETIWRDRRRYNDYLLWELEFYHPAELFTALVSQGYIYAANQSRWLMQLSFV
jgi:hypothetical protein